MSFADSSSNGLLNVVTHSMKPNPRPFIRYSNIWTQDQRVHSCQQGQPVETSPSITKLQQQPPKNVCRLLDRESTCHMTSGRRQTTRQRSRSLPTGQQRTMK